MHPRTFTHPKACCHVPRGLPAHSWMMICKARSIASILITPHRLTFVEPRYHHIHMQQSYQATLAPFASLSASSSTFNSLFKVLFISPSWYLFTIGLEPIFSCRWNLPPFLRSNLEERDSREVHRARGTTDEKRDSHPRRHFFSKRLPFAPPLVVHLQTTTQGQTPRFPC